MRDGNCGIYDAELNLIKNVGSLDVNDVTSASKFFRFSNNIHDGVMDIDGNILVQPKYSINGVDGFEGGFPAGVDGKWGILDLNEKWLVPPIYTMAIEPDDFGTFWAKTERGYGLRDFAGNWLIQPQFDDAEVFDRSGLAWVQHEEKFGLIDRSGRFLIAPKYYYKNHPTEGAFDQNGFAIVQITSMNEQPFKYQLIDRNGNVITNKLWQGITPLIQNDNSIYYYFHDENSVLILDKNTRVVSPQNVSFAPPSTVDGIFRFIKDGKVGYMKLNGTILISPQFDGAFDFDGYSFAKVWKNERWLIIDKSGRVRYRAPYGTEIENFGEYFVVVKAGAKFGAVNYSGETILPTVYDHVGMLSEDGIFEVTMNNKLGIVDKYLDFILPISIPLEEVGTSGASIEMAPNSIFPKSPIPGSGIWDGTGFSPYSVLRSHFENDGWAWLKRNGKWGRINKAGRTIYPFTFDQPDCYSRD